MDRVVLICFLFVCLSSCAGDNTPSSSTLVSFNQGFIPLYGERNIVPYDDHDHVHEGVQISMDETTGSGFRSKLTYLYGYFQTSLKLPENHTAGVVVTFYACNDDKYHDEIDFEFLGHVDGQNWLLQTNFYGNGSTDRGREERYELWFDPSQDFHRYGILWGENRITYYVDDVPVRHVERVGAMGADFPSKEMGLYGTIWNGSDWATAGGRYKLDLRYGPFVARYSSFVLRTNEDYSSVDDDDDGDVMGAEERGEMKAFRRKLMTYSYCYDRKRYAVPLPECVFDSEEFQHLQKFDPSTFGSSN